MKTLLLCVVVLVGIVMLAFLVYCLSIVQMVAWIRTYKHVIKFNKEKQDEKQV